MMKEYNVAILGATGAVGTRLMQKLAESNIPVKSLKLLASKRSAGKKLKYRDDVLTVEEATPDSFDGVDLVLASAGGAVSKKLLPEAVKRGAVAVDNTSAFRMDPDVPLVVPEVNPDALENHHGIIANPNCSTIQMVVALEPIRKQFGLKQIIVSTYQAASGAGQSGLDELRDEAQEHLDGKKMDAHIFPVKGEKEHYPLAFNLLPQIDVFEKDGYTHEEWKMIHETKKIMLNDMNSGAIKVTATCVRVPVEICHGESVYFTVDDAKDASREKIQSILNDAPGVTLKDDPKKQLYPQPIDAAGKEDTYVGRVRPDQENDNAYNMWVVADNLLKGAALNTVEIGEELVKRDLI
ncbi:aspartate-semialdehyde dehydrogenase [Fructilactobacillus fructivorans]|nr:aspartate-semialdehyde dehydrogenase [Fructilactobacillus fructivorans]MCT0151696.1 aspartate-semialdehyde dehydrogenase [Fructilactobacillus fructivorans]MCT2867175.1 aspartate-semialdehyde dehydrogenase [Fructilactobacillus fructivorans]MCT2868264.1 aspartate-semialdehyde dehydrogenase [Fructilactobacillus fructivorans]MCT2872972.1 aspartate-semialdehyde dehydrogenase [Fructilactobacillus fructivorans]